MNFNGFNFEPFEFLSTYHHHHYQERAADASSGGSGSESDVKVGPSAGGALGDPDAFYRMLVEQTTEEAARYDIGRTMHGSVDIR